MIGPDSSLFLLFLLFLITFIISYCSGRADMDNKIKHQRFVSFKWAVEDTRWLVTSLGGRGSSGPISSLRRPRHRNKIVPSPSSKYKQPGLVGSGADEDSVVTVVRYQFPRSMVAVKLP